MESNVRFVMVQRMIRVHSCEAASVGWHWTSVTSCRCRRYRVIIWVVLAHSSVNSTSSLTATWSSMHTVCCGQPFLTKLAISVSSPPTFATPLLYVVFTSV